MKSEHSKKMKELRKEKNITQDEIAKKIHISTRQYNSYETGQRTPTIQVLIDLANYYNVTLDYITGNEKKRLEPTTNKERQILMKYRQLKKEYQKKIEERIDTLQEIQNEKKC